MASPSNDPFASAPDFPPPDEEIDASLENDFDMNAESGDKQLPMSFDCTGDDPLDPSNAALDPPPEARIPLKKDISLKEFMGKMDEYAPIIPDAVTAHALILAGLPPPNPSNPSDPNATPLHLSRLLALATQKFIADIAADAYQYSRMRSGNTTSNNLNAMGGLGIPGAPGQIPGQAGPVGGVAGQGAAGGGTGGAKEKGGVGQHVLGMQRAGFGGGGQGGGQGRTVLTMEDLGMAVGEYGVNVKRGEFYR
ncbi:hypothetical protein MMC14_006679 [Varicellaria rhodocarpa]|nr:hypothetical protein [Varicellaria rhodocarpa]